MWTFRAASSSRWRDELRLGERRLEIELASEAHALRDLAEELVDGRDADRREHLVAVGVGEREEGGVTGSARPACTPSTSSSASTSDGSRRRIRMSQPSPYGSSFTVSGASTAFAFTSSTSPESGAIRSETALTDSTSPYDAVLRDRRAHLRRLVVDELAERVLREPGDAEHRLVAVDPRPVVLAVVLQVVGIALRGGHSAPPLL